MRAAALLCCVAGFAQVPERAGILARMQEVMGPLPPASIEAPVYRVIEEAPAEGYRVRRIAYRSPDGEDVPALLLLPDRKGRAPAALCLHQTTRIGKSEPAGLGGRPELHYGAELARRGWVVLAPDYPNFGDYTVDVYALGYASATMKGIVNHRRAVDVLRSLPEVDAERIAAIGHSLGGHNALFAAAFDERIRAVVTSCGFNSFRYYMKGDLTGWSHQGYMPRIASVYGKDPARMPFDFSDVLRAIAPRAVFVNAPLRDANFEVSGVRDAVAAAAPAWSVAGALRVEHPDAAHEFPPAVREAAYRFLEQRVTIELPKRKGTR